MTQTTAEHTTAEAPGANRDHPAYPCPILEDQVEISARSNDLIRLFRKLNADYRRCRVCPADRDCALQASVSEIVTTVISEVRDEWDRIHCQI